MNRVINRWLASVRRHICGSKSRAAKHHVGRLGQLDQRIAPAAFTGGVTIASADVNGDGAIDLITGAGPGGVPVVNIYDGQSGALIRSFFAFDKSFAGGIYVAAGDVNGDGRADVIVGAGQHGGPHVRVFDGGSGAVLRDFFAYEAGFTGGVRVAAGDVNGDGLADIITGAGPGGGPHVMIFNGIDGKLIGSKFAYDPAFRGGVYVGAAELTGDKRADVITGAGEGGEPIVNVFNVNNNFQLIKTFHAFDKSFRGGVRVAGVDLGPLTTTLLPTPPTGLIYTAAGPGGGPHVRIFDSALRVHKEFFA